MTAAVPSAIVARVDDSPASYLTAARELGALGERPGLTPLRVAVLASFTFDLVTPYLQVEAARRGVWPALQLAPFGQLEQQALDPASPLYAQAPDVIVVAVRVEDVAGELGDGFLALAPDAIDAAIDAHVARLAGIAAALRARSTAHLLMWNQAPLARIAAGLADPALARSQQHAIAQLNERLAAACRAVSGAHVFDVARLATEVGVSRWYDARLRALGRIPFAAAAQVSLARGLARSLRALVRPAAKCLVLDLDNTLWGGVLGEDGAEGIALGEDYPGNAFKAFQRALRGYRDRGVLLAIASKNNEADVVELFAHHAELVLRLDDFAARQIHWNDKASSLRAIADALGLGLDALVFFDDNPVERAWVREQIPEVTVIDVPADPLHYVTALDQSGAFDQLAITDEDRGRAGAYRSEVARAELARTSGSVEDFLRALDMTVTLGAIDASAAPRVVQLLGKTNQFNLTTRRHTEAELAALLADRGVGLWMRVRDRYGEHGLVGVALAVPRPGGDYALDTLLMSCRVLGRRVELALLDAVARRVHARGAHALWGEFVPTRKNAPAADFLATAGFARTDVPPGWRLDLDAPPARDLPFTIVDPEAP